MKLGFLTACLPQLTLEQIVPWAAAHDYDALEVATWPSTGSRDFEASHLDVAALDQDGAERVKALFDQHGVLVETVHPALDDLGQGRFRLTLLASGGLGRHNGAPEAGGKVVEKVEIPVVRDVLAAHGSVLV